MSLPFIWSSEAIHISISIHIPQSIYRRRIGILMSLDGCYFFFSFLFLCSHLSHSYLIRALHFRFDFPSPSFEHIARIAWAHHHSIVYIKVPLPQFNRSVWIVHYIRLILNYRQPWYIDRHSFDFSCCLLTAVEVSRNRHKFSVKNLINQNIFI